VLVVVVVLDDTADVTFCRDVVVAIVASAVVVAAVVVLQHASKFQKQHNILCS